MSIAYAAPHSADFDWVVVDLLMGGSGAVNPKLIRTPDRIEAVRRLHGQGLPDNQIAERTGMSRRQVLRIRHGRLHLPAIVSGGRNAKAVL